MTNIKIILLTVFVFLGLAVLYISMAYPFVRESIPLLIAELSSPEIKAPNSEIDTLSELETLIESELTSAKIPGASVAIVSDGAVSWQYGYGQANEQGVQVSPDTPFKSASITKAVTGVTIMHAVEAGLLDLDRDINEYLTRPIYNPNHPDQPITLRHLATHTSGLVDNELTYANSYTFGDATQPLAEYINDYYQPDGKRYRASNFSKNIPGSVYQYSNIATGLAAYVFQEAVGTRLDVYAKQHIFAPLGMTNTGWFLADFADTSIIAQPYVRRNRPFPHYGHPSWAAGGVRTSANDLARLLAMVMNEGELDGVRVLAPDTVTEMIQKQNFAGLAEVPGEGIFWNYSQSGLIGHSGGDFGIFTMMYFNPETDIGAVILTNSSPMHAIGPVVSILLQITNIPIH